MSSELDRINERLEELETVKKQAKRQRRELLEYEKQLLSALADPDVDNLPQHLWGPDGKAPSHQIVSAILEVATNLTKLKDVDSKILDEKIMLQALARQLGGGDGD